MEGLFAQIHLDSRSVLFASSSFLFLRKEIPVETENQKAVSPDLYLWPSMYIYTCTAYAIRYICLLSLQYIWICSGLSRCLVPIPGLTSEYHTCSECVCAYTRTVTQHIHINPLLKIRRHSPRPNESLTLETSAINRPAGNPLLPPLFYTGTHVMVFKTPVNTPKTHVKHTYAKRR